MTDSEKYLSPDEYCKLKGISRKTLSRVIKEDKVIVKKISKRKILIVKFIVQRDYRVIM